MLDRLVVKVTQVDKVFSKHSMDALDLTGARPIMLDLRDYFAVQSVEGVSHQPSNHVAHS